MEEISAQAESPAIPTESTVESRQMAESGHAPQIYKNEGLPVSQFSELGLYILC